MTIKSISNYFKHSVAELEKVTWPTKNQAVKLTIIVFVFCLVVAFGLGALDLLFSKGYHYLLNLAVK